jgi:hypothetical protein
MKTEKTPMWVPEQTVLGALLSMAMWMQFKVLAATSELTLSSGAIVVASSALTMVAQKVRSMGDRQQEQNKLAEVAHAHMACAPRVAFWGLVLQVLGAVVSLAQAPTWAHALVAAYVAGYTPIWRRAYRRKHPATLEAPVYLVDFGAAELAVVRAMQEKPAIDNADIDALLRIAAATPAVAPTGPAPVEENLDEDVAPTTMLERPVFPQHTHHQGARLAPVEMRKLRSGQCPDCEKPVAAGDQVNRYGFSVVCNSPDCGSRFKDLGFGVDRLTVASPLKPVQGTQLTHQQLARR